MKPETLQLLQSADDGDPENCYNPPGFNWRGAMNRVRSIKPMIEEIIGRSLEMDENVQDASFFTELAAHVPGENRNVIEAAIALTFSAFGDLFTVWSSAPGEISESVTQEVITAVQESGFRDVDSASLSEAYSGDNRVFQGDTWLYRFFSYL